MPEPSFNGINLGKGLAKALAHLGQFDGKSADRAFRDLFKKFGERKFFQQFINDKGALQIGFPELKTIMNSGEIGNPNRLKFLNTLQAIGHPKQYNPEIGLLGDNLLKHLPPAIFDAVQALSGGSGGEGGDGGGGDGGGGDGGGGDGGGGGGPDWNGQYQFGEGVFDISQLPNFDLIQETLAKWLSGENPLVPLDIEDPLGGLRGLTESSIRDLLMAEGLPEDVIRRAENSITSRTQAAQSDSLRRARDVQGGRNIFGGTAERTERDIDAQFGQTLAQQLSELGLQNALHAAQQRQVGVQGANLLGNLGLATQSLGIQGGLGARAQDLQALSTGMGGLLGMGNLQLDSIQTDLQRQLEEFRLGLLAQSLFQGEAGSDGGGGGGNAVAGAVAPGGLDPYGTGFLGGPGFLGGDQDDGLPDWLAEWYGKKGNNGYLDDLWPGGNKGDYGYF